jgi:hypothetical protein
MINVEKIILQIKEDKAEKENEDSNHPEEEKEGEK